jgi:hypothetical protein
MLFFLASCKQSAIEPTTSPLVGENSVRVLAYAYDEFRRQIPVKGTIYVSLISGDGKWATTIPDGKTSCTFVGLPRGGYILDANENGFYPYETAIDAMVSTNVRTVLLYSLPPPTFRIESITSSGSRIANGVHTTLITSSIPPAVYLSAAVFYGLSSNVSPTPGTYLLAATAYQGFTSNQMTDDQPLSKFQISVGTHVYVTARLMTGASATFFDSTGNLSFTNLEQNTKIVTSFVLQ